MKTFVIEWSCERVGLTGKEEIVAVNQKDARTLFEWERADDVVILSITEVVRKT